MSPRTTQNTLINKFTSNIKKIVRIIMQQKWLISWIGNHDLKGPQETQEAPDKSGPIVRALHALDFDQVFLLHDYPTGRIEGYLDWLKSRVNVPIRTLHKPLENVTDFGEIYRVVRDEIRALLEGLSPKPEITFHLSPGTPAMAAVWILLGKAVFRAELIKSSREAGVESAEMPFDLFVDFLPDFQRESDERMEQMVSGSDIENPAFEHIIHRSAEMKRAIGLARRISIRSLPVLIEGESGTGKELFAKAMHNASPRKNKPFIAINCGAIPLELFESEFFGYLKGAFTGAYKNTPGYFESAHEGTLFLDEIGDLPPLAQVKLLRTLQEKKVTRLGCKQVRPFDVRIIAATNRNLLQEINKGRFREDLFYRLAVAVLRLPPLRTRRGDLSLLINHFIQQINEQGILEDPHYKSKKISARARNLMLNYPWPGNVRELFNTLQRSSIWTTESTISLDDMRHAMMLDEPSKQLPILGRPLGDDFSIQQLLAEVATHYLKRALEESNEQKTKAAEIIGLPSYQTFNNWIKKYGVEM